MEKELLLGEEKREVEILEFSAGGNRYGVDINDIREILPYDTKPTPIPNAHPYIIGIIMPRDFLIPIIDITKSLNIADTSYSEQRLVIVTSIGKMNIAFLVDDVMGMHRTTTDNMVKPGRKLTTSVKGAVVAILNTEGRKIEILELRKLITDINPEIKLS
jgi:two-component system chemotaxis response regulator CheV